MDCSARVWDVTSGECLRCLAEHHRPLHSASFSPDEASLLTASFDSTVRIWKMASGCCALALPADGGVVAAAAFSPDGDSVLVASGSESVRLFGATHGECRRTLAGHSDWVRAAAFSPDSLLVASASYDGTARVHSAVTGVCLQTLSGLAHDVIAGETRAAFYHKCQSRPKTACEEGAVAAWEQVVAVDAPVDAPPQESVSQRGSTVTTSSAVLAAGLLAPAVRPALALAGNVGSRQQQPTAAPNGISNMEVEADLADLGW